MHIKKFTCIIFSTVLLFAALGFSAFADNETLNGLQKTEGVWYYYQDGEIDTEFVGMAKNQYGWWYVENGTIDFTYTGASDNPYGKWYMKNGKLDTTYTGFASDGEDTLYMKNGKLDAKSSGLIKGASDWKYVKNGKVDTTFVGMAKNQYGWWYVENGTIDFTYTGASDNPYGIWYMKNGKLDTTYTGFASYKSDTLYMKNGKFDTKGSGLIKGTSDWKYVKNGKVDTAFVGMAKNQYGWWYVKNGTIDFSYTGIAKNQYGTWYMKNGKLDTSYTGKVETADGSEIYVFKGQFYTGNKTIGGQKYYFTDNGKGYLKKTVSGNTYFYDLDGNLQRDKYIATYYVNSDGVAKVTACTKANLNAFLDDILDRYGRSEYNIYCAVRSLMSYKYTDCGASIEDMAVYAINNGKGACWHFASLSYMLYKRAGYDVYYVDGGTGRTGNQHRWIYVKFNNGTYYYVDTVYPDGYKATATSLKNLGYKWDSSKLPKN